jgi:cytochrome c oxidase assembly protein subunit 11
MNKQSGDARALAWRHRKVAATAAAGALAMLGAAYAAVPLYTLFCQTTGFGGTPLRATQGADKVLDRTIRIRFDANTGGGLPWKFEPVQRTMEVRIGETSLAFYRATNRSDKAITGSAVFNVAPDSAGGFFNKIACFCFTEQRLDAGETVEMPVSFFIDPAIVDDKDARGLTDITLSYTFYPVEQPKAGGALSARANAPGKGS